MSKHFSLEEFGITRWTYPWREMAREAEILRWNINCAMYITSGKRTPAYNRSIGGRPNSQHLLVALDFEVFAGTPARYELIGQIIVRGMKLGILRKGGVGIYDKHVHWDRRGKLYVWRGTSK